MTARRLLPPYLSSLTFRGCRLLRSVSCTVCGAKDLRGMRRSPAQFQDFKEEWMHSSREEKWRVHVTLHTGLLIDSVHALLHRDALSPLPSLLGRISFTPITLYCGTRRSSTE